MENRNGIMQRLNLDDQWRPSTVDKTNMTYPSTSCTRHTKYAIPSNGENFASEGSGISSYSVEKHLPDEAEGDPASELLGNVAPSANEVGMQKKISELRVALQASERTRAEVEHESMELRNYLAKVEVAASGLQSRVRELEDLLKFSPKEISEIEELRGKVAEEASIEAQAQAAAAAQAVAVARDATMEVDKVKREATALLKSQEEEISRLSIEATHWHGLYQARSGQLEALRHQLEKKQNAEQQLHCEKEEALDSSRKEITTLRKQLEAAKLAAEEKASQSIKLTEALELAKKRTKSLEHRLEDMELGKNEVTFQNELLEQQVKELQGREVMATVAHYDRELRKMRAVLGGEKAQLLSELAFLRDHNNTLKGDLVEWQEKFKALSHRVSGQQRLSAHVENEQAVIVSVNHDDGKQELKDLANLSRQIPVEPDGQDGLNRTCMQQNGNTFSCHDNGVSGNGMQQIVNTFPVANGNCTQQTDDTFSVANCHDDGPRRGDENYDNCNRGLHVTFKGVSESEVYQDKSCFIPKDRLLTAAHKEIIRLKEINQWLLAQVGLRS